MYNIVKSQNYQIRRDMLVIIMLIISLVCPLINIFAFSEDFDGNLKEITGSSYVLLSITGVSMLLALLILIVTTKICGGDFQDKTINYEIMSGHSRLQVYDG